MQENTRGRPIGGRDDDCYSGIKIDLREKLPIDVNIGSQVAPYSQLKHLVNKNIYNNCAYQ